MNKFAYEFLKEYYLNTDSLLYLKKMNKHWETFIYSLYYWCLINNNINNESNFLFLGLYYVPGTVF